MIDAFLTWQSGVLLTVLALGVVLQRQRPSRHALLALVCFGASIFLMNAWIFVPSSEDPVQNQWLLDYGYKVFNAGINGALVVYLGTLFYFFYDPPERGDVLAKMLWLIVFVAETFSLFINNITCNLIAETASRQEIAEVWGSEASRYVCGREFGEWLEWTPIIIEMGMIAWIVQRWMHSRQLGKY